jgi:hypothetical protein
VRPTSWEVRFGARQQFLPDFVSTFTEAVENVAWQVDHEFKRQCKTDIALDDYCAPE